MTAPRTRLPRTGRRRIPLRDHPFKLVLVSIDLLVDAGMPRQKATLLMTALFFAKSVEPLAPAEMTGKLRRVFAEHGGLGMSFTLPSSGNPKTMKAKERMQSVDTLNKMDKRYSRGADLKYRKALAQLVQLAMFFTGDEDERRKQVDALLHRLDDPDPQIHELAGLLLK